MSTSMSSDNVAVAFAHVYQAIIDQTDLPSSELPTPRLASPAPARRGGLVGVAVAVAVVVGVGGVALLRQDTPVSGQGPVDRVALLRSPGELDSPLTVVNSSVSTEGFEIVPPVDMWRWEAGDSPTDWVALLEADPESDLTAILGPTEDQDTLIAPTNGQVVAVVLADSGWFARSWMDGSSWRIAIGYDESTVAAVADQTASGDPSQANLDEFSLVYEGPQTLYPRTGSELSELFYRTPTGGFELALFRGWADGTVATRLRSVRAELTVVNGADAVISGDEINWWISWEIDDQSTAFVQSSDFGPDVLKAIAEAVTPVSAEEWEEIARWDSPPTTIDSQPTASSFEPVTEQLVVASGERWAVKSQAVTSSADSAEPGQLGFCGWVEVDGTVDIDFGCQMEEPFGQVYPSLVRTPDGLVVTGSVRTDVAAIRFEGTPLTADNTIIDPRIPFGWFAVAVPDGMTLTQFTYWDVNGNQLPVNEGGRLQPAEVLGP